VLVNRRQFVTGLSVAAGAIGTGVLSSADVTPKPGAATPDEWEAVRAEFKLSGKLVNLGLFFLASNPRPVREAIARYREALDDDPVLTVERAMFSGAEGNQPLAIKASLAGYIGGRPEEIALTGSTTEGLALVYNGLPLSKGDEILTTQHDHYVHHESIRFACERTGATSRRIALFDASVDASEEGMVERIRAGIAPATRVLGVTWVHSSTGVKLPIAKIAAAVARVNESRPAPERVLVIVDGVHGIGVEDPSVARSGVDFFVAGAHKWLFAPRGTGFIWAPAGRWALLRPTIPTFESLELFEAWGAGERPKGPTKADWISPGGFHSFEHQWAIPAAIDFHTRIGPRRVTDRIHTLNLRIKEGLAAMPHVTLHTPVSDAVSAGIVCFEVDGMGPNDVVERLLKKNIVATTSPYRISYARLSAGIMNSEGEIDRALDEVRRLKG